MTELNDNTPVFCTAEIPEEVLNSFFREAYAAPGLADEGIDDVGMSPSHCPRTRSYLQSDVC